MGLKLTLRNIGDWISQFLRTLKCNPYCWLFAICNVFFFQFNNVSYIKIRKNQMCAFRAILHIRFDKFDILYESERIKTNIMPGTPQKISEISILPEHTRILDNTCFTCPTMFALPEFPVLLDNTRLPVLSGNTLCIPYYPNYLFYLKIPA